MKVALNTLVLLTGAWISASTPGYRSCSSKKEIRTNVLGTRLLWYKSNASNMLKCAVACVSDLNCLAFSFSPSKKMCRGYSKTLKHYMKKKKKDEILYETCRVATGHGGNIGKRCTRDDECDFRESVCYIRRRFDSGMCLCKPGLYYSPKHNACQRNCSEFGEEMDEYKELAIIGHNNKGFKVTSLAACKQKCVTEESFLCLTVDYHSSDGECLLSKSGYLDVGVQHRESGEPGWILGQRQCK